MTTPVIQLLLNGEEFLLQRHLKRLFKKLIDPATRDFNFERVSARDRTGEQLVGAFQTLPMMADSRTVVVDDFETFKKDDLEALSSYFQNPNPQTHVILIADKIDKRTGFYKKFAKVGEVIEFKAPYANKVPAFIQQEAQTMGLLLEPGCADVLAEAVGTNLMSLVGELEKLKLYVHPGKNVTRKQVSDLVSTGLVSNVFAITNLIGQKRYHEVHKIYVRMKEQGEPVIRIVALVINHFRKLMLTKSFRGGEKELASLLGVHPFFVKDYSSQAQKFSEEGLKGIYKGLMELSVGLRSVGASSETLFQGFLQGVCVG